MRLTSISDKAYILPFTDITLEEFDTLLKITKSLKSVTVFMNHCRDEVELSEAFTDKIKDSNLIQIRYNNIDNKELPTELIDFIDSNVGMIPVKQCKSKKKKSEPFIRREMLEWNECGSESQDEIVETEKELDELNDKLEILVEGINMYSSFDLIMEHLPITISFKNIIPHCIALQGILKTKSTAKCHIEITGNQYTIYLNGNKIPHNYIEF